MSNTMRVQTVIAELDRAALEYVTAKNNFERARIAFEVAKTKFAGIRQLATHMLSPQDWAAWHQRNQGIRFAAISTGDAVMIVLRSHAYNQALAHFNSGGKHKFAPAMPLQAIATTLEQGGFDFQSSAPLREINAALINLQNVTKTESGLYEASDAQSLFEMVRKSKEGATTEP